ncbi:MAG: SUMF1/EgtB/PvdO family nonheme iron enzyme [Candidatus Brocadiaceae bacterium]|nr:SUMF1/EgtB/PvdO family nonheme iron enzyme [Candidatus Brocadiaceae bacterium]
MKDKTFRILHLSDLHTTTDTFNASVVLKAFINRLKEDKKAGLHPEIVVVTGDIASHGTKAEYDSTKGFFDRLLDCLCMPKEKLFIVPGNHDVNRGKYRPSEKSPEYHDMEELNNELENELFRADLLKGMDEYFTFIEKHYPHLTSRHGRLIPFVSALHAECGKKIGLVGLNSAWMCWRSGGERKIAIGEYQIIKAMEALEGYGKIDLRLNICHHPLAWLWPEDRKRCKLHLNNSIMLNGHLHDTECSFENDMDTVRYQFQAGGIYLIKRPSSLSTCPYRFHYITFDWKNDNITLDFREYIDGKWSLAGSLGQDGRKEFPFLGKQEHKGMAGIKEELEQDRVFGRYMETAFEEHRFLQTKGFETGLRQPIEIEQVYINMRGNIHGYEHDIEDKENMKASIDLDRLSSLDIKGAFGIMEQRNIKDMVILGDPGSGKTTLLKYMLIMLVEGNGKEKLGIRGSVVPFFAPLRDLKDPDNEKFVDFIMNECNLDGFDIGSKAVTELLEKGRAIILLDGLDEVADRQQRVKTCGWIDRSRRRFPGTKFVITSRFAGYMEDSRLDVGAMELYIQDFTQDEVHTFLTRWYEAVEAALNPGQDEGKWRLKGRKDAQKLFEDIIGIDYLMKLAKNPLILQIIALVHRDRGRLPQRRVELYDECTNVLLEKWDMAKGLNVLLTAREARSILQPLALWLHGEVGRRSMRMEEIIKVIKGPLEELGKSDLNPEELLRNIRDRSGIFMGYSESEYGFTHLSFQEYLSAEEVRNLGTISTLIGNYNVRWWREVILLCLALDNPSVIEKFMELIIPSEQFKSGEISIVLDAITDSIKKPSSPFLKVAKDKGQPVGLRQKVIDILSHIRIDKVITELKELTNDIEKVIVVSAYQALKTLNAADGIQKPLTLKEEHERIIHEKDSSEMVLVPGGDFLFGSREDDKIADSNEKPQKIINLPDFYMDVYPVTNDQYCVFLNAVEPTSGGLESWIYLEGEYQKEKCRISEKEGVYTVEEGFGNHPVIYVYWNGADAYAKWARKRLPTEQEWEKVARGTDGRAYPWGEEFRQDVCNTKESGIGHTTPVGKYPEGKSFYGCYDMSGNVWEWTSSLYKEGKNWHTIRGGSWRSSNTRCRCAARVLNYGGLIGYFDFVGFRCART